MADEISRIQLPNGNSYDVKDTVARQTLEHYKTPVTVTLAADGWSSTAPFSQTLEVAGITDSDNPIAKEVYDQSITLDAQKEIKKQTGYIDYGVTADGTVTFICLTNKPSVNITLTLSFMSGGSTISGEDPGTVRVALDNEIERAKAAEKNNADKIDRLNGTVVKWGVANSTGAQISDAGDIYASLFGGWLSQFLGNGVDFLRWRGNSGNLNLALANGIYIFGPDTVDRPDNQNYGIVLVLNNGNDTHNGHTWFFQIALPTTNNNIYLRRSINASDGGGFSKWTKFTGTIV